jgi:hypothetical protein
MNDFEIIVDEMEYLVGQRADDADPAGSAHAKLANITDCLDENLDLPVSTRLPDITGYAQTVYSQGVTGNNTVTVCSISGKGVASIAASAYQTLIENPSIPSGGTMLITIDGGTQANVGFFSAACFDIAFDSSLLYRVQSTSQTGTLGSAVVHKE